MSLEYRNIDNMPAIAAIISCHKVNIKCHLKDYI